MPLSLAKIAYEVIYSTSTSTDSSIQLEVEPDQYVFPKWAISPSISHGFLNDVLPYDEAIMEVMAIRDG